MAAQWYSVDRVREMTREARAELDWMDRECLPEDEPYPKTRRHSHWWVVRSRPDGSPAGFAGSLWWPADRHVFLCRAGVLPAHRGNRLQRRLVLTRLRHARELGAEGAYTYTHPTSLASANTLIGCGFRLFEPAHAWGGEGMLYWIRGLSAD